MNHFWPLSSRLIVDFTSHSRTHQDPETKRAIWRIITNETHAGRALVITTHSMEEADTLCSKIAIMATGRLRCLGTQQHLKNKYVPVITLRERGGERKGVGQS